MQPYQQTKLQLQNNPQRWLVTGAAGFIGANLLEALLKLDQIVVGLDNFSTGYQRNLDDVQSAVSTAQWNNFTFINGDIRDIGVCRSACEVVDLVLHQAALGSVPRSLEDPLTTNASNVSGFLNMLVAARDAEVKRFVYAASSSTYGDHQELPKVEDRIGQPLSPYAVTKYVNELYATVFSRAYQIETIGLRYFNVFGPRQDPHGAYAAVIPLWFAAMLTGTPVYINGDGETSRDFCYIENAVQSNILAAVTRNPHAVNQVYNIAFGERTTLTELFDLIADQVMRLKPNTARPTPAYRDYRPGDVRHSLADISKARTLLGYVPEYSVFSGLAKAAQWYENFFTLKSAPFESQLHKEN